MTPLRKTVSRRTTGSVRGGRRLVVSLHPGDVLGFRPERTRTEFTMSIEGAFYYAVRLAVAARKAGKGGFRV